MRTDSKTKSSRDIPTGNPLHSLENLSPSTTDMKVSSDNQVLCDTASTDNSKVENDVPKQKMEVCTEPFKKYYEVEKVIGRGVFGSVKRCRRISNGQLYAAKFQRKSYKGEQRRDELMKEVAMLERLIDHPRVVRMVELYESPHELIIVTEYVSGGELHSLIDDLDGLSETHTVSVMRQLLEVLVYLHDHNIVHLDLKPQNILLQNEVVGEELNDQDELSIKLCDFGSALLLTEGQEMRQIAGTENYVPPEVLRYDPLCTASDMWSLGVVAYIMLTGRFPFAGDNKQETFLNISQVNLDFPDDLFQDISQQAQDFIADLLVANPRRRLTARQCLQHPWLQSAPTSPSPTPTPSPILAAKKPHVISTTSLSIQLSMPHTPPGAMMPPTTNVTTNATIKLPLPSTPLTAPLVAGSPQGCRRTLSPPSEGTTSEEPTKKCRCETPPRKSSGLCDATPCGDTRVVTNGNCPRRPADLYNNNKMIVSSVTNSSESIHSSSSNGCSENGATVLHATSTTTTTKKCVKTINYEQQLVF